MNGDNFTNHVEIFGGKVQGFIQENYGTVTQNFITQVSKLYSGITVTEKELTSEEYRQRTVLLGKVKEYWIKGVLKKSFFTEAMIELGLEERSDVIERPFIGFEELPEKSRKILPTETGATEFFDEIGEGRTLLILGEPGSGKTITLLKLAENLIARAEEDQRRLIPVVFNLSSWKIKRQKIADWLIDELWSKYGVAKTVGKDLIENQQLIMLLDGLDEVKAQHQEACVQAINQFMEDNGQTEVVVCSRIEEYEALSTKLRLRGAIFIRSLTPEQINQYLDKAGEQLQAVKTLLQEDNVLQELARSPLTLSIMSLAYRGKKVEELHQIGSVEERHQHLFDSYIERMFKLEKIGKPTEYKSPYGNQQTKKWLTWLAQRMTKESQTVFLIEQLQPRWLKTNSEKILYVLGVVLFIFLVTNLVSLYTNYQYLTDPSVIKKEINLSDSEWSSYKNLEFFTLFIGGIIKPVFLSLIFGFVMFWKLINNKPFILCKWVQIIANSNFWHNRFFAKYLVPLEDLFKLYYHILIRNYLVPDIEPIETVSWSFGNALKTFKSQFKAFFILAMFLAIVPSVLLCLWGFYNIQIIHQGLSAMILDFLICLTLLPFVSIIFGLTLVIVFEPVLFVLSGISIETSVEKTIYPNQGIKKSLKNIIPLSFIGLFVHALNSLIIVPLFYKRITIAFLVKGIGIAALSSALTFALLAGGACIKHIILRIILFQKGYIPWDYASFLNYAAEQIFMRKVGGSYIFIHRTLQEHFASREITQQSSSFYKPVQVIPVESSTPVQNHIICTNCGNHNSVSSNFCIKCGTKLTKPHF